MSITLTPEILLPYKNNYFVETGTYLGGGVDCALAAGFPNIISIERYSLYHKKNLIKYKLFDKVKLIHGDTEKVLYAAIKDINSTITFWLDAHDIGGPYCALLPEIAQIGRHDIKHHTILIDDKVVFEHWGFDLARVMSDIKKINSKYEFKIVDSKLRKQDIVIATISKRIKVL